MHRFQFRALIPLPKRQTPLATAFCASQNLGMYVSAEVLAIVVSAIGLAVTVLGGMFAFARFLPSRMDRKFDEVREEFRDVREEIAVLRSDLHAVDDDVADLKVAVARIEGPRPRLLPAR